MKTTHQSTTTKTGQEASYGYDRGTSWVACDHGKNRRTVIYATPTWANGLARLRDLIAKHGITIRPEHAALFENPDAVAA